MVQGNLMKGKVKFPSYLLISQFGILALSLKGDFSIRRFEVLLLFTDCNEFVRAEKYARKGSRGKMRTLKT